MLTATFTEDEFLAARKAWGCNCGPASLAFALQTTLDLVRPAIPDFETRRYTSPMMMAAGLQYFGERFTPVSNPSGGRDYQQGIAAMFGGPVSLVRIQWTGPWTDKTGSAKWAATRTHWVVCWRPAAMMYDCNVGVIGFDEWESTIAPAIMANIPRSYGDWYPADVWQLSGTWSPET
jgi:hypothetical protein